VIAASLVVSREAAYSKFEQAVLDALQLAFKVTANSLYGQIGSRTSPIYLKDIAACTTATGREMIMMAKNFVETNYEAEVIYGDSVTGYTPIIVRNAETNVIHIENIDSIANVYGNDMCIAMTTSRTQRHSCNATTIASGESGTLGRRPA
jgi:hypothetical protein